MSVTSPSVTEYYNRQASTYDEKIEALGWTGREMLGSLLDEIEPFGGREGGSVLDLGAGTGYSLEAVTSRYKLDKVVAVDGSAEMLARFALRHEGRFPLEMVKTDLCEYVCDSSGISPNRFDLVLAIASLHFLEEAKVELLVSGIGRRLKPGAHWFFTYDPIVSYSTIQSRPETPADEEHPAVYRQYPETMTQLMADHGLRIVRHRLYETRPEPQRYVGGFIVAQVSDQR